MRVGIDLDNTIVCYDGVFHRVARQLGWLPDDCADDKQAVRDFLRDADRDDDWTRLQGIVYGKAMCEATLFPDAASFISIARRRNWDVFIVSHRTRRPYLGPDVDLHQAARDWLHHAGITDAGRVGLPSSCVFLEESLAAKLNRICDLQCAAFIDDLPELLLHGDFPPEVERICFDPCRRSTDTNVDRAGSWSELIARWFGDETP